MSSFLSKDHNLQSRHNEYLDTKNKKNKKLTAERDYKRNLSDPPCKAMANLHSGGLETFSLSFNVE